MSSLDQELHKTGRIVTSNDPFLQGSVRLPFPDTCRRKWCSQSPPASLTFLEALVVPTAANRPCRMPRSVSMAPMRPPGASRQAQLLGQRRSERHHMRLPGRRRQSHIAAFVCGPP